jgi:ABC-type branched-subunit amino acid transport system substrate-binding protein
LDVEEIDGDDRHVRAKGDGMKRGVVGVVVLAIAVASAVVGTGLASAQAAKSGTTDVGVTKDDIRIAVVADVDNPFKPGLFQGAVDGVNAAVKSINASGGVAGRKLKVDFIDSKVNAAETRNAIITACGQDFALVGTAAAFLTNVQDETSCKDLAGQATGLPDLASFVTGVQQCSPVAYPVNPSLLDCATKEQHPQTYYGSAGTSKWYRDQIKGKAHGLYVASNDSAVGQRAQDLLYEFPQELGMKSDQHAYVSSTAPQSAYTPIVQKMKADKSNFAYAQGGDGLIALRQEAALQGIDPKSVMWLCNSCYDAKLPSAGAVVDGTYQGLGVLPFEEAKSNKNLATLVKNVGSNGTLDQFAVYGFAATLLFKQAAEAAVKEHGSDGLTRVNLLSALSKIQSFDAGGMIGTTNIGGRRFGPCYMVMQIDGGKWKRVFPKKAGTFDCDPKNLTSVKVDQPTA